MRFIILSFLCLVLPCIRFGCYAQKVYSLSDFSNYSEKISIGGKSPQRGLEFGQDDQIALYPGDKVIFNKKNSITDITLTYNLFDNVSGWNKAPFYSLTYNEYLELKRNLSPRVARRSRRSLSANQDTVYSYEYKYVHDDEVNTSYKEKRIALVIGNTDYEDSTWQDVSTCKQSAFSVAEKLRSIGFHTMIISNANLDVFFDVLHDFMNRSVKDSVMIKLFYYVGHGMRIDGYDYIVPIDAGKNDAKKSIKNDTIAQMLGQSENANYNLLFFDACRDTLLGQLDTKIYEKKIGNTCVVYSTQKDDVAIESISDDETITPFSNAFINTIGHPNSKIDNILKCLSKEVDQKTSKTIDWKPANLKNIGAIRLNREKTMCWLGGGGTFQIPFESELPISFAPNLCLAFNNIFLGRYKTQFEIELGWNVFNKNTLPVYLYDDSGIKYASEMRNTFNLSCRYGPSFDICRHLSISPMFGISYHYLKGNSVDKIETDVISSNCTTLTLDVELSYKLHRKWKANIILGSILYRPPFLYKYYKTLKNVTFMKDWYTHDLEVGVGLSYRLTK